jgi:hypothetical protein
MMNVTDALVRMMSVMAQECPMGVRVDDGGARFDIPPGLYQLPPDVRIDVSRAEVLNHDYTEIEQRSSPGTYSVNLRPDIDASPDLLMRQLAMSLHMIGRSIISIAAVKAAIGGASDVRIEVLGDRRGPGISLELVFRIDVGSPPGPSEKWQPT